MAEEQDQFALSKEADTINRRRLLAAMRAAGVEKVTARYCGCGDSGQFESIEIEGTKSDAGLLSMLVVDSAYHEDTKKRTYQLAERRCRIEDAAETLFYYWLDQEHSGFENNEGGEGEITVDVASGKVDWVHDDFYREVVTTEHKLRMDE